MENYFKRLLSLVMVVLMVVSMVPTTAFAAEADTADLTISTADELKAFADEVNAGNSYEGKLVVLANDIDLEWTAVVIGTKASPFKGTFDGQNHTVSKLSIYEDGSDSDYFADSDDCLGLFGVINTPAVIKNVTVHDPYIVGSSYIGGIVGMGYTGKIENCHVTGEIDIEGFYMVGGITGHGYARITDCSVIGKEGFDYNYIGATYKEADLEGDNVGGIVGHNAENNVISGCTVKNVTVSGTRKVGGIVGITAQSTDITGCKVEGVTVETTATAEYAADNAKTMSIGGIVGQYMADSSGVGGTLSDCTVSGLTFANEKEVAVNAGALTGGVRASSGTTTEPTEGNITVSGNCVASVSGGNVTYLEPEDTASAVSGTVNGCFIMNPDGDSYITTAINDLYAEESVVLTLTDADGNLLATSALVDNDRVLLGKHQSEISGTILIAAEDAWWNTEWEEGKLHKDYVPATITLYVDGKQMDSTPALIRNNVELPLNWAEVNGVAPVVTYVAEVNGTKYESLRDAITAAESGDTVKLLTDVTIEGTWDCCPVASGVTIDGGDHTLKIGDVGHYASNSAFYGSNYNVQNLTIERTGTDATGDNAFSMNGGTAYNVTVNGNFGSGIVAAGDVVVDSCIFNNTTWGIYAEPNNTVGSVTNSTFNSLRAVALYSDETFTGNTVNGDKGLSVATTDATITGNTFNGARAMSISKNINGSAVITGNKFLNGGVIEVAHQNSPVLSQNYWSKGYAEQIVPDGDVTIGASVGSYYADEALTELVTIYVAEVDGKQYATFPDALAAAGDGDTITVLADFTLKNTPNASTYTVINKDVTVDLNGKTIQGTGHVFRIEADVTFKNGTVDSEWMGYTFRVVNGNLTIESGTYIGQTHTVYVSSGTATILGGDFSVVSNSVGTTQLINCYDSNYNSGAAQVEIKGGTFHGFNPMNNVSEGENTNFCAEGFAPVSDGNGNYSVHEAPKATVTVLDPLTLTAAEHDYMVWPSGDDTVDRPLEILMNFKANETLAEAQAGAFAKWKTDFYITVTGIEGDSFTADNCYLAGNYGTYGWIVIPMDGVKIEEGVSYPVVSNYDANLTYENICDYVKDFTAAIHVDQAILDANPDLKIELALRMTNPNDAADVLTIGEPAVYTVDDLTAKVATVTDANGKVTGYATLDEAFAAANAGDEVKILAAGTYSLTTSGKDITVTGEVDGVVFDNIGAKNMGSANVTFNNVTFDYYPNKDYTGLQHAGNLVYNNCTINGQVFLYGASETFNNCTFNQNSANAYNVWTYGAKEVAFNECTFNCAGKSVLVYNEGACATDLTVTESTFKASEVVAGKAAIEIDTTLMPDGTDIVIDGDTTATGFDAGSVSGETLWNDKKDQTDLTVTVDGVKVWPVSADMTYSAYGFNAAGEGEKYRENFMIDLYDINAAESLVVELYAGETLIATTALRQTDRDDDTAQIARPITGTKTVNVVVAGRLAGSWDTQWHVAPSVAYIPDTAKIYADGKLVDTYTDAFTAEDAAAYAALPGVAKAASVTNAEGTVYYATVQAAIDAAGEGETVKLEADVTLTAADAAYDYNGTSGKVGQLFVAANKNIVLDLNGYTLQNAADCSTSIRYDVLVNAGTLKLTDSVGTGKLVSNNNPSAKGGFAVVNFGAMTIENTAIDGNNGSYAVVTQNNNSEAKLTVNNAVISGRGAIQAYNAAETVINSGSFSIDVATSNPRDHVIYAYNSTVTVNGGTFDGTASSCTSGSSAVYADGTSTVTVNGGVYTAQEGSLTASGTSAIAVTAGSFNTKLEDRTEAAVITLTGGTYVEDVTDYCAPGYEAVTEDNTTWTVQVNEDIVAWNTATGVEYETVAAALAGAKAGETVQLLADADEAGTVLTVLNGITLDLNGHTLSAYYVFTTTAGSYVIDSTNGEGLLEVAKDNLVMAVNSQIMVWKEEEGGYRFAGASFTAGLIPGGAVGSTQFAFWMNETKGIVMQELFDGTADSDGLSIQVKMTYTNSQEGTSTLYFDFPAELVQQYADKEINGNGGYLYMNISGLDKVSDVSFAAVVKNGSVLIEGTAIPYEG